MPVAFGSRCKIWLASLLIWVLGFQEIAWAVPLPSIIELKNATPFLHKSSMDKAPNGVDLLQTFPSDAFGTFFQPYHQFNVGEAGLIFNNFPGLGLAPETPSPVFGKLGGAILENPLLKGKQAALRIVQSIEGGAPTRLSGPLEVYGPQTELILANPAGFMLDRVSFLNISKVTLITGKVHIGEDGFLGFVEVQDQSSIQADFDEAYLDRVGQLNLISSLIKLSGETTLPLCTHMKILSGVGAYDLQEETLQPLQPVLQGGLGTPPPPVRGIDAKLMGGLEVGSAHFEVLQIGSGLMAPKTLIARRGNLQLTAQGAVHLGNLEAKTIFAGSHKDQICLKAGDLVKAGQGVTLFSKMAWVQPEHHSLVAKGNLTLKSASGLTLGGKVQAQGILDISAKILTQRPSSVLQAQGDVQLSVLDGKVVQSGVISSLGGALELSARTFSQEPTAVLQAQGNTTLRVDQRMALNGSVFSHGGTLTLLAAALSQGQGHLYGKAGVVLTSAGPLVTPGAVTSYGSLKVTATSWTHGILGGKAAAPLNTAYAKDGIDVKVTKAFQLGSKVEACGALTVSAKQVDIQETGSLQGHKGVHLQTSEKLTTAGAISSDHGTVKLIAPLWQQTRGKVEGQTGVTVNVDILTTWGALSSLAGALLIQVESWVHGLVKVLGEKSPNAVQGAKGVKIVSQKSVELEGSLKAISGKVSLWAQTLRLKDQVDLSGNDGVHLTAFRMVETFGNITSSAGDIALATSKWLHHKGVVKGSKGIEAKIGKICEIAGCLDSTSGKVSLWAPTLRLKEQGNLTGNDGVHLTASNILETFGNISSWIGDVTLTTPIWFQRKGAVRGTKGIEAKIGQTCEIAGRLDSASGKVSLVAPTLRLKEQGELSGNAGVVITASKTAETFGNITSLSGSLALTAPIWFQRKGIVKGNKGITLKADQLTTSQGTLDSEGHILLQAKQWRPQDVPTNTCYILRGIQGVDLQIAQEMKVWVYVESASGKVTLKTKKMEGPYISSFLGHGGVEIAVESPLSHICNLTSKAGKIRLQAPSFYHVNGSLSGHQGVELALDQVPSGVATLQNVVSEAGVIAVRAHTVTQTGTELKGARGVVLNLTGSANVDRVGSRDGKVEITADALKRGVGNVIQGTQGVTLNLKQALATQTHFISPQGTLALNAPSFQFGGTLQGKDIKLTASQGIDVGSEVVANTLWMQAPEVQVCPQGFVAASDIQLRGDRFALQGTMLNNSYNFICNQTLYVAPSGKQLPIPQDQPQFIPQRLAQGPLLAPKEVNTADKLSFNSQFRGISYAGTVKTGRSLDISGPQLIIPLGGVCETDGKLSITTTGKVENEGNLLSQGGMEVRAPTFENKGSLGVVGKASFETNAWLQTKTGTTGVSGDLETTGDTLINEGQLDVGGTLRGSLSKDVTNRRRISCGTAALRLDGNFINRSQIPGLTSTFVALKELSIQGLTVPKADLICNHASLLESLNGSVFLKAKHILNERDVVVWYEQEKKFWEPDWGMGCMPAEVKRFYYNVYKGYYSWWHITRAFYDSSRSEPEGQILAGQHLVIEGDLVENASSLLSARGDAWIHGTLWNRGEAGYTHVRYFYKSDGNRDWSKSTFNLEQEYAPSSIQIGGILRSNVNFKRGPRSAVPPKPGTRVPYGPESQFTENANISWGDHRGFAPQPQTNLQALAKTKLPGFAEQILQKAKEKVASGSVGLNPHFNPQKTFTPTVSLAASAPKTLLNPQVQPQIQSQLKTADQLIAEAKARALALAEAKAQLRAQLQPQASAQQSLVPLGSTPQAPNAANYVIDLVKSKSRQVKKATHLLLQTQGMQVDPEAFLSSDYAVQRITYFGNDPERVLRVGDGYFEAQLIQDQILKLTGFSLLRGYQDVNTMIQTLYENGFRYLEAQLERRYQQPQHARELQGPWASKAKDLANLRTHHIVRGPDRGEPLPDQDMLILEPVQLMLPQDEEEGRDQLALALTAAREALTSGRPVPKSASAVLELWAPRFYPCQKTLDQWRVGTVAKQMALTLGDEPLWGQTFEADQACFQNPRGDFHMFGGGIRVKENLALIFNEGECNLYGTQLLGSGEDLGNASKVLLYGGKHLKFEAQTLEGQDFGHNRLLGTSPTLQFRDVLAFGGEGGLSIQSAILKVPHQLTLLSQGEIGIGALASEFHSYSGGGGNWRKDDRITHRLTQAEVGELLIATPDNLKVTGLEVTADKAKIQLGGGFLAESPQDLYHHSHHTESDGWFSSSSEDVSTTTLSTQRNVLNIQDASVSGSRFVDRGGAYRGHAHATSPRARVEAVIDKLEHVENATDSNLLFKSGESRGDIRHTPVFTRAENLTLSTSQAHLDTPPGGKMPEGLTLTPFNPAALQPPHIEGMLQSFLEDGPHALEASSHVIPAPNTNSTQAPSHVIPTHSHVIPAQAGTQEIPEQALLLEPQVTLHPVQGTHKHWDKSTFGLTPGFGAVLGLAVTLTTGTPLGNLASNFTGATQGFAYAATKAGMQAVAAATVVGTANHQGNLGKALEDLGKPASLRNLATSMATAGLIEGASLEFNLPNTPQTFGEHFQKAAIKGAISVHVQATLGGIEPGQAFASAALGTVEDTLGGVASQNLGEARLGGMGFVEHKLAHGLIGAATGAILNLNDPGRGATAGALGAVIGETVAELSLGVPKLLENQNQLSPQDLPNREQAETAKNLSILSAATAALLTKQDVHISAYTATTAVENNNRLVVEGLKYVAKLAWQKSKHLFVKRAAKEAQKEAAKRTAKEISQKSSKNVAKEPQKPQKIIGKREKIRKTANKETVASSKISQIKDIFNHRYKYHSRIRERSLQDPIGHNFPYSFDDIVLKVKPIIQKDGSLLYRKPGVLGNAKGYFEMAINPKTQTIFHRTFVRK